MITEEQQELYFKNHNKVVLPLEASRPDEKSKVYAATVAANFESMGFALSKTDIERLSKCSPESVLDFYQSLKKILDSTMMNDKDLHPFYPNFPEEVMEKDRLDIFIDQFFYGLTGFELRSEAYEEIKERLPFVNSDRENHRILFVDEKEYYQDMRAIMRSAAGIPAGYAEEIYALFKSDADSAITLLPEDSEQKSKENKMIFSVFLSAASGKDYASQKYLRTAVDVLRYAAGKSAIRDYQKLCDENNVTFSIDRAINSVCIAAGFQYDKEHMPSFKLSRKDRTYCAKKLEEISRGDAENLVVDMYSHRSEWKRFFNTIHIPDLKELGTVHLIEAMNMLRNNVSLDRYTKRVEEAIKAGDIDTALFEAKAHPGDFVRRFDKLLRMALEDGKEEKAFDALKEVASKSGISPVMALSSEIRSRTLPEYFRTFSVEKNGAVWREENKNRAPIPEGVAEKVHDICIDGLATHFAGKGRMGNVYVSPELSNIKAPISYRTMNEGVDVATFGTVQKLKDNKDIVRLFVGWNNIPDDADEKADTVSHDTDEEADINDRDDFDIDLSDNRVDLDLTAELVCDDGSIYHVGWNGEYAELDGACVYSGDVQDGSERRTYDTGVATDCAVEYIDLDRTKLKKAGVQYVVTAVASFTRQYFSSIPYVKFGFMQRNEAEGGNLFEVSSVSTIMDIKNNTISIVPLIYDVQNDHIIFVNKSLSKDNNIASHSISSMIALLPYVKADMSNSMSERDIVEINAAANGRLVHTVDEAEIVFMTAADETEYLERNGEHSLDGKKVILSNDYAYFAGVLMAEPSAKKEDGTREDIFHPGTFI